MNRNGRLTWNNRDDAEGGVTAALIEKEVKQLTQLIANQAHNAREDQRVIEEQEREIRELRHALTATTVTSEKAEIALADVHERDETVARLEQRLTEDEVRKAQADAWDEAIRYSIECANETTDSWGNMYRLDWIARMEHEIEQNPFRATDIKEEQS